MPNLRTSFLKGFLIKTILSFILPTQATPYFRIPLPMNYEIINCE